MIYTHLITFRDCSNSEILLKKISNKNRNYLSVGDDAFDLRSDYSCRNEFNDLFKHKKVILCQFRNTNYEKQYALKYWKQLAAYIETLALENKNICFVFISMSNGDRVNDTNIATKIKKFTKKAEIIVIAKILTPEMAKGFFKNAYLSIGQSYHFGVFSLAEGVPFVGCFSNKYYEDKLGGLLEWYDHKEFLLPENKLSKLPSLVGNIIEQNTQIKEGIVKVNKQKIKNINKVFHIMENI